MRQNIYQCFKTQTNHRLDQTIESFDYWSDNIIDNPTYTN